MPSAAAVLVLAILASLFDETAVLNCQSSRCHFHRLILKITFCMKPIMVDSVVIRPCHLALCVSQFDAERTALPSICPRMRREMPLTFFDVRIKIKYCGLCYISNLNNFEQVCCMQIESQL